VFPIPLRVEHRMNCAALLASYFAGVQLEQLDRNRVYDVPASIYNSIPAAKRLAGRACARVHKIQYRIVQGQ